MGFAFQLNQKLEVYQQEARLLDQANSLRMKQFGRSLMEANAAQMSLGYVSQSNRGSFGSTWCPDPMDDAPEMDGDCPNSTWCPDPMADRDEPAYQDDMRKVDAYFVGKALTGRPVRPARPNGSRRAYVENQRAHDAFQGSLRFNSDFPLEAEGAQLNHVKATPAALGRRTAAERKAMVRDVHPKKPRRYNRSPKKPYKDNRNLNRAPKEGRAPKPARVKASRVHFPADVVEEQVYNEEVEQLMQEPEPAGAGAGA